MNGAAMNLEKSRMSLGSEAEREREIKKTRSNMRDRKRDGPTDRPTDGPTDGQSLLQRCVDASKKFL